MHFSKHLLSMLRSGLPRELFISFLLPFLQMGQTAATFHFSGKLSSRLMFLKILRSVELICSDVRSYKIGGMPLGPRDFVLSSSSRMDLILALEMLKFVSVGFSTLISSILNGSLAENTELKKRLKREAWFLVVCAVLPSYSISN